MIKHIDHITYAISAHNEKREISNWKFLKELVRLNTIKYPAIHIALTSAVNSWEIMTGLSVSEDSKSPINEFIKRYGEGVQHIAYSVDPNVDMEEFCNNLPNTWDFMTPVLSYSDNNGAKLKQIFTKPSKPFGTFKELVQRLPNENGQPFNGFDIENIDELYRFYDDYSIWLDQQK